MPENFASYGEYQRHIGTLIRNDLIQDTSKIWWDLRPSWRYPTLETRIMDVCTNVDDSIALASLNRVLATDALSPAAEQPELACLCGHAGGGESLAGHRYSFDEGLLDLAKGELVPFSESARRDCWSC